MIKNIIFLLTLNQLFIYASQVDTLIVQSESMNKSISNIVILPDNYSEENQLPAIYLLHGYSDNHETWMNNAPKIKEYADKYNVIIVCPDANYSSWYFDSPIDDSIKYETYISSELVKSVDRNYNTIDNRNGRAITGLSMGGHGAFYLSFKHQDVWGAAGSISGGVDIVPFPSSWDISKQLGKYSDFPENWKNNSVINMVDLLQRDSLKLIFDCGIDDFFYDANFRLHNTLKEKNIPHDYTERPGMHNWDYFSNSVEYHILFFKRYFNKLSLIKNKI
jgi:S-formylglutathione hydrolase FrmB